jgi:hypothetical protein
VTPAGTIKKLASEIVVASSVTGSIALIRILQRHGVDRADSHLTLGRAHVDDQGVGLASNLDRERASRTREERDGGEREDRQGDEPPQPLRGGHHRSECYEARGKHHRFSA